MPTQHRTVQLPDHGYASVSRLTEAEVTIRLSEALDLDLDRIILEAMGFKLSYSPENWSLIIPAIFELLPADLRDDVANAICAAAGEMAS